MSDKIKLIQNSLYNQAVELIEEAKSNIVRSIHNNMVKTYYDIGRMIVEEEQKGKERAEYGKSLMKNLSQKLQQKYKKGYSQRNIEQMRQFFLVYSKTQTLSA